MVIWIRRSEYPIDVIWTTAWNLKLSGSLDHTFTMLSSGLICLLLVADSAIAINRYGYTMNSCGDFRPRRVDTNSVEGSHFGSGQHQSGSNRFGPSADGAASPDGFGQPILMTSFAPYRIWIENNRYRRGGVMKGPFRNHYRLISWLLDFCQGK